jgi:hypothetical protein
MINTILSISEAADTEATIEYAVLSLREFVTTAL